MQDQIIEFLNSGKSVKQISELLNVSYYSVQRVAKHIDFNFYEYKKQEVLKLARNNTPNQVCKILGYGRPFVIKIYKQNNLPIEGSGGKNRVLQDISSFLEMSDDTKYWLGIIVTDGNLGKRKSSISIVQKDVELLEKFKNFIKEDIKIYKVNNCHQVLFGHRELHKFLISLNITPNKSKTIDPNFDFNWHFVRGLIDGDGHISKDGRSGFVTASKKLKDKLLNFLEPFLGKITNWIEIPHTKTKTYRMQFNKTQTKILISYLYKNANYYLKRKFDLACSIVQLKPEELLGTPEMVNQQPS